MRLLQLIISTQYIIPSFNISTHIIMQSINRIQTPGGLVITKIKMGKNQNKHY